MKKARKIIYHDFRDNIIHELAHMRVIAAEEIAREAGDLYKTINYRLDPRMIMLLRKAMEREQGAGKEALKQIVENTAIAAEGDFPLCQDTGFPLVWIEMGDEVAIHGHLSEEINGVINQITAQCGFRASIVEKPFSERINTKTNTPVTVHLEQTRGDKVVIQVMAKGAGTENATILKMLNPGASQGEIIELVKDALWRNGPETCPPLIIGMGIGGTAETALYLSKKALLEALDIEDVKEEESSLEQAILKAANETGIGPMGWGGRTTALAVKVKAASTHMACLPVAVSFSCHSFRAGKSIL